ncbi:Fumarylacetoacetate (FAA) hydrolase family protein [compost metagenome]
MEALEPFRTQYNRGPSEPQPMPYLASDANRAKGAYDVQLEVLMTTAQSRDAKQPPVTLSRSNFRDAYWNVAQLIAHHTVNGCNLQPGDMLGTGTLSGPQPSEAGSLLELSNGGKTPIDLPWGEKRTFLQDGDQIIMRAACEKAGYPKIGFGQSSGVVLPAKL